MLTLLTTAGIRAVTRARKESLKIKFSSFQVGFLEGELPDLRGIQHPNYSFTEDEVGSEDLQWLFNSFETKFQGEEAGMTVMPVSHVGLNIKCYVPKETDYWRFNCVILFAEIAGEVIPFCYSYYLVDNPKLSMDQTGGGMRYYFVLQLRAKNRDSLFDYSNLASEVPTFDRFDSVYDLDYAIRENKDQFIVKTMPTFTHTDGYTTPHLVINTREQFYGTALTRVEMGTGLQEDLVISGGKALSELPLGGVPEGWELAKTAEGKSIISRSGRQMIKRIGE